MSALALSFDEIDRFNAYAQANSASVAELLADIEGLEDLVSVANKLDFRFGLDDVKSYIRERSQSQLSEEQLAMVAGGGCTFTYTFTYLQVAAVIQLYAIAQVAAAAEVAVAAIAVLVVVLI
jgi:hypothetical protein